MDNQVSGNVRDIPIITGKELALCVCAHQDDEAFIAARLREHRISGDHVRIIYTTLSFHKGERYRQKRMKECREALKLIDIESIDFLGFPDGESYKHISEIAGSIRLILSECNPSTIYIPAYEGGHIDHDVANFCVSVAAEKSPARLLEFPLYSGFRRGLLPFKLRSYPPGLKTFVTPLPEESVRFMREYWRCYPSQFMRFLIYVHLFAGFKRSFGYLFLRPLPEYDYRVPPVHGVAYEQYLDARFDDFRKAIEIFQGIRGYG